MEYFRNILSILRCYVGICIPIEKIVAETRQTIWSILDENTISYMTSEKWFQRFQSGILELKTLLRENPCRTQLQVTRQATSEPLLLPTTENPQAESLRSACIQSRKQG